MDNLTQCLDKHLLLENERKKDDDTQFVTILARGIINDSVFDIPHLPLAVARVRGPNHC